MDDQRIKPDRRKRYNPFFIGRLKERKREGRLKEEGFLIEILKI